MTEEKKPVDRSAIGRRSKAKGSSFERDIVNLFKEAGVDAKRGWWQSGLHAAMSRFAKSAGTKKTTSTPDVIVPGLWVECSTGITSNLSEVKLRQAKDYADEHRRKTGRTLLPVAIVRKKGCRTIDVTMAVKDFLALVGAGGESAIIATEAPVTFTMDLLIHAMKATRLVEESSADMFEGEVTP